MKYRMVDRVTAWERGRWIRGVKAVSFEEYQLKRAWGEAGQFPRLLVLESLVQLGRWLVVLSSDFTRLGVLDQVGSLSIFGSVCPGEHLEMKVTVTYLDEQELRFDAGAMAAGRPILGMDGVLRCHDLAKFADPADLRVLFAEIHRPAAEASA